MMKYQKNFIIFALLFCLFGGSVSAYKYLVILPTAVRSHHNVGAALAKGLAGAGHEVTIISAFPQKKPIANLTDIFVPGILKTMGGSIAQLLESSRKPIHQQILKFNEMGYRVTRTLLEDASVQELLKSKATFDAVISEIFLNEAQFGLAEYFNAPLITYSTFGAILWNTDLVGTPSPPSYVPHPLLKFGDHMSLLERISNLAFITFEHFNYNFIYLPEQERIYKEYFPNNKQTLEETRRNTALVLLNQHVSLSFPRPYSPNMIEVGGMHINRKANPLPADIEKFINDAKHGVIYFSLGSNVKSKDLPIEKREIILNVLSKLKQRVLWKFEEPNLPNKPDNVFISDWFPQDDILAHKNVLAFITHGGLLSTTESIYHGKPLIGIPIFADQFLNMARAEQNGYGITVKYEELSEEKLKSAIERIINEPKHTALVREMSARFRDQKEPPLERAIYWVEHVTRHKGARYLRSASQDLNFIQYHNLDAMLILYGGILLVLSGLILLIVVVIRLFVQYFTGSKRGNSKKVKRH